MLKRIFWSISQILKNMLILYKSYTVEKEILLFISDKNVNKFLSFTNTCM